MKDVGVEFAQSSGKAIAAQVLSTKLAEEQNNIKPFRMQHILIQMEHGVDGVCVHVPVA